MDICWLEQTEQDVPAADDWLSPGERLRMAAMRFPKRRLDWRLGRWTAKSAVSRVMGHDGLTVPALSEIEVGSLPSGVPLVRLAGRALDVSISLSHRAGRALCSIASGQVALGCDLEVIEPRASAFIKDYFTDEERGFIERTNSTDRDFLVTLVWSAKESALKALHVGLTLDTRSVAVNFGGDLPRVVGSMDRGSGKLEARCRSGGTFHGWFEKSGDLVRTFLTNIETPRAVALPAPDFRNCEVKSGVC